MDPKQKGRLRIVVAVALAVAPRRVKVAFADRCVTGSDEARRHLSEAVTEAVLSGYEVGVPVWEHAGIIRQDLQGQGEADLRQGAALADPSGLFNSSLQGNTRRAIDIGEGETIDGEALKALIRAAAALNMSVRADRPVRSRRGPESA